MNDINVKEIIINLRPSLFWVVALRWLVDGFRRFRTTYRNNLQGQSSPELFVPKRRQATMN
jgi:hypothetical protein